MVKLLWFSDPQKKTNLLKNQLYVKNRFWWIWIGLQIWWLTNCASLTSCHRFMSTFISVGFTLSTFALFNFCIKSYRLFNSICFYSLDLGRWNFKWKKLLWITVFSCFSFEIPSLVSQTGFPEDPHQPLMHHL